MNPVEHDLHAWENEGGRPSSEPPSPQRRIEELEAEMAYRSQLTWCAYCGFEVPIDADGSIIAQHIATCEKHPMRVVEAQRDEAVARIRELEEEIQAAPHPSGNDGTNRLVLALHDREAVPRDYLGGSNARMLHEAADEIVRLSAQRIAAQAELLARKAEPSVTLHELRGLVIDMRRYMIHHGTLIGECVAWERLKQLTGVGQDRDCPSEKE